MKIQRKALEHYGVRNQLRQLQEECGEVITTVNHVLRARVEPEKLLHELVDVDIMLEQFKTWFDQNEWEQHKKIKLIRLQDRMRSEKKESA